MGLTVTSLIAPSILQAGEQDQADPTRVPGRAPSLYGSRAPTETAQRLTTATHSLTPHQVLHGIITPSALHFERHHNGVPAINPDRHRLLIHGLVDRPLIFSMSDLMRFPSVTRTLFIECSGNSGKEWKGPVGKTVQETHGLMNTSEWTGVPLMTVLAESGIKPEAAWILAEGSDAAAMTRSLPLAEVLKDGLLCYAQNGEALRPEQGYPLRLVIPGWEGNTCIKWIRRLKVGIAPFMTREETSRYTDLMPDGTARQFTFVMEAKSVITSPSGGQRVEPGFVEIPAGWLGAGAERSLRSMSARMAGSPGTRRNSKTRCLHTVIRASGLDGVGTEKRRSFKAAALMRPAMPSRPEHRSWLPEASILPTTTMRSRVGKSVETDR
ncbi:MAG: molybdopterin-dependent oxidoreductase [Nitrospira sp.]|nr:molybdopterin-dependent oxidoreductase [Nitrospira sp.]MCW5778482.1 molybdopterin-dependent oxidoreductase [Nitrospira sp.]